MNNIKALVSEDPASARRAIDLLSELLRTSLYSTNVNLIALGQEIALLLNDYLELEKMRFEKRLQIDMDIPKNLFAVSVLPLSIQTLVENAIKHGISNEMIGGTISIRAALKNSFLEFKIQNPGQLTQSADIGLGLKNLRERLNLQYNGEAVFSIVETGNKQVLATLILPIR